MLPNGQLSSEAAIRQSARAGVDGMLQSKTDGQTSSPVKAYQDSLEDAIFTVNCVDITISHRAAAINSLCAIIQKCQDSSLAEVRSCVWENDAWTRCFEAFLLQHHGSKPKFMRQLSSTLTAVLSKETQRGSKEEIRDRVLRQVLLISIDPTGHTPAKPAMQALGHFITKDSVPSDMVSHTLADLKGVESRRDNDSASEQFVTDLLQWSCYEDSAPSVGQFLSALLDAHQANAQTHLSGNGAAEMDNKTKSPWIRPVINFASARSDSIETSRYYIFPHVFQRSITDYVQFLGDSGSYRAFGGVSHSDTTQPEQQMANEDILFCALSVGKELGMVQEAESSRISTVQIIDQILYLPEAWSGRSLTSNSANARLSGSSISTSSPSVTRPLTNGTFRMLKQAFPHFHADTDANFRSEVFGLTQRLMDRLRAATSTSVKRSKRADFDSEKSLKAHKAFVSWYSRFLRAELRPTASYQRHISSLKCMNIVLKSGLDPAVSERHYSRAALGDIKWPYKRVVVDQEVAQSLLDLLMDPFDDVRFMAAAISKMAGVPVARISKQSDNSMSQAMLSPIQILERAEHSMMRTGRADQADGVAHLYEIMFEQSHAESEAADVWWATKLGVSDHLLSKIEKTLNIAKEDSTTAVSRHPSHGLFSSVRYIVDQPDFYAVIADSDASIKQWPISLERISNCLLETWSFVKPVLCNDAPEGFTPEEVDDENESTTKDISSYSWRASKEASLVMRSLVSKCPLKTPFMSVDQLEGLGDLCFTELAESRHRGAFSTVAQTFVACCARSSKCGERSEAILEKWYKRAVSCVQNKTTINTRRSAGIPSLMTGILTSDTEDGKLFSRAIADLTREATEPVEDGVDHSGGLPQVHALNSSKDIFKNSKLGERSELYVAAGLDLAASCLSSNVWAIRNCGLMLFRASLDRLLGTNDSYNEDDAPTQTRLSFLEVPNLISVILRLSSPPEDTTRGPLDSSPMEGVFPALQLSQRAVPPADRLPEVRQAVLRLTTSSHWHLRDKAARTYALLEDLKDANLCDRFATSLEPRSDRQNALHGSSLCAKYILARVAKDATSQDLLSLSATVGNAKAVLFDRNRCPFTKAAFSDSQTICCRAQLAGDIGTGHNSDLLCNSYSFGSDSNQFAAESGLRTSLARSTIHQHALEHAGVRDATACMAFIQKLAARDADACVTSSEEAVHLLNAIPPYSKLSGKALADLGLNLLLDASVDQEVKAAAQTLLLTLSDIDRSSLTTNELFQEGIRLPSSPQTGSPSYTDGSMMSGGAFLDAVSSKAGSIEPATVTRFSDWSQALRKALHEDNAFDTRIAAVKAAAQLKSGSRAVFTSAADQECLIGYCLAVYEMTVDDDDEVRDLGATVACNILSQLDESTTAKDLVPSVAGSRLAELMTRRFHKSDYLATEALRRLTGGDLWGERSQTVSARLSAARKQDTALFVQEKQNSFIDEAREVRLWSHVLLNMSPRTLPDNVVHALTWWTITGSDELICTAEAEQDGALGWTRKSEVFTLGSQVIYAAEVLLYLRERSKKVPVLGSRIKAKLVRFVESGRESEVNALWLEQTESVLQRAMMRRVRQLGAVLVAASSLVS